MKYVFNSEIAERDNRDKRIEYSESRGVGYTERNDAERINKPLSPQELAEVSCQETKAEILKEQCDSMSKEQIERISNYKSGENIKVLSAEEYVDVFPEVPFNVIGHCDIEGNIYMKNISGYQVEHTSTHETIHMCSFRDFENSFFKEEERVGLRHTVRSTESISSTKGRGINEGVTEMYTKRELKRRGAIEGNENLRSYEAAQAWARRLEYMVGKDNLEKAYFGGEDIALKVKFNDLNDNEIDAWDRFSEDVDIVEYSDNAFEIQEANKRLSEQFAKMYINKMSRDWEA